MNFSFKNDLILALHTDDGELGCGSTIGGIGFGYEKNENDIDNLVHIAHGVKIGKNSMILRMQ